MRDNLVVLSGSSNLPLAEKICRNLGITLTPMKIEQFSNEDISVQIKESIRKRDVFIVQSIYPNPSDMLVELHLMIDAAKKADAREVCVVMPHYSYARSDKKDKGRIPIGAKVFIKTMEAIGADRFLFMTLHSEHVVGFSDRKVDHLQGSKIICDHLKRRDLSNAVALVDLGQEKRSGSYADVLGIPTTVYDKRRIDDTTVEIRSINGPLEGMDAWIFDDEIASAVSGVSIAEIVHRDYHPKSINFASVHGLLCGKACDIITASPIKEVIITNTVNVPPEKTMDNLTILDAAPMLAEGIKRIYTGESISEMLAS